MNSFMRHYFLITMFVFLGTISTQTLAMNAKLGQWEWTTSLNIPGLPAGLPLSDYRSCISSKNLVPKPPGNEHCKIISHSIDGNRVDWKMSCSQQSQSSLHTGNLIFNKTTAMGESLYTTNGETISAILLGSYIGSCK